jgi:hypothetical protein
VVYLTDAHQVLQMTHDPDDRPPVHNSAGLIGVSVALGIATGVVLGVALDNLAVGLGLGAAVGMAVGVAIGHHDRQLNTTSNPTEAGQPRRTVTMGLLIGLFVAGLVGLLIFFALRQ